ncbi:MAG TPA: hypothetical protein VMB84_01665 [Stellaceae bacterium]|nr:hypothetical protein [Stellaceae bacterium]
MLDQDRQSLWRPEIIGEALVQLRRRAPDTAALIPETAQIIGFRNVLIHAYGDGRFTGSLGYGRQRFAAIVRRRRGAAA